MTGYEADNPSDIDNARVLDHSETLSKHINQALRFASMFCRTSWLWCTATFEFLFRWRLFARSQFDVVWRKQACSQCPPLLLAVSMVL